MSIYDDKASVMLSGDGGMMGMGHEHHRYDLFGASKVETLLYTVTYDQGGASGGDSHSYSRT